MNIIGDGAVICLFLRGGIVVLALIGALYVLGLLSPTGIL